MSLRAKLLVPTVLTALLLSAGIGYFSWVQYEGFREEVERRSSDVALRLRGELQELVARTATMAGRIAEDTRLADSLTLMDQDRVLGVIRPFYDAFGFDLVSVYDVDGRVLARADSPAEFGAADDLQGWVLGTLSGQSQRHIVGLFEDELLLLARRRVDSAYGALGVVVIGCDLDRLLHSALDPRSGQRMAIFVGDRRIATALDDAAPAAEEGWHETVVDLTETLGIGMPLRVALYEDTAEARYLFWRRLAFTLVALTAVCGAVITLSHRLVAETSQSLDAARQTAEGAARSKSDFLANMSHEIRTPMTAILGYADLLLDPTQGDSDRINCIQTIRRNGDHLLAIINDILDLSKIEAGKLMVERIDCSPCQVIGEVASLMRGRATEKGLALETRFEGPIPELIQSDPTRLRQILLNLTGNAVKFTAQGTVTIGCRLLGGPGSVGLMQFEVSDTGIGLSPEQQERIFKPFSQADTSTTRKFGGSGLGLTICKRLAKMLGGDITLTSAPGSGSTFRVVIDTGDLSGVQMLDNPSEALRPQDDGQASEGLDQLAGRVLLAEDGRDNQLLISIVLKKAGLAVDVAENGRIACDKALGALQEGEPYDVILMDMQMPELDGYAATARLRIAGYRGPIIALTAHAMAGDRDKCLQSGCNDYAAKPINRDVLLATVARHLPQAQAAEEAA